jgi:DNA-binding response OmpR family regulator
MNSKTAEVFMANHILVAEDDPKQADLVRLYLERDGFDVSVVADGRSAVDHVRQQRPDLLVLDVMMPRLDGLDVLRELGDEPVVPVVLLTARSTENDVLLGLYLGADDYITKPFSPRELVARVRAVLRRSKPAAEPAGTDETVRFGDITVAPGRHEVTLRGQPVEVTPVEFEVLLTLVRSPGRVFTRRQLLERVHGTTEFVTERTIDAHVMNLRRKIERDPRQPTRLLTVYGVGYKLADPPEGEPLDPHAAP